MTKKADHLFTIEEALKLFTSDKRISKGLGENAIKQNWENIMGKVIASHTTGLYLKGSVLYVYFDSSIIRSEFRLNSDKAKALINESLGEEIVSELIIK